MLIHLRLHSTPAVGSAESVLLAADWQSWRGQEPAAGKGWLDTHPMELLHNTEGASLDLQCAHISIN